MRWRTQRSGIKCLLGNSELGSFGAEDESVELVGRWWWQLSLSVVAELFGGKCDSPRIHHEPHLTHTENDSDFFILNDVVRGGRDPVLVVGWYRGPTIFFPNLDLECVVVIASVFDVGIKSAIELPIDDTVKIVLKASVEGAKLWSHVTLDVPIAVVVLPDSEGGPRLLDLNAEFSGLSVVHVVHSGKPSSSFIYNSSDSKVLNYNVFWCQYCFLHLVGLKKWEMESEANAVTLPWATFLKRKVSP